MNIKYPVQKLLHILFSGEFKKIECISLSGSQGRFKDRLKSWWRGENWMQTHWSLARPRYNHVSWKVPGGVVLFGGAGGWVVESAELVKDGKMGGQELYRLGYTLEWVHFFLFPILCSLILSSDWDWDGDGKWELERYLQSQEMTV